MNQTIHDPAEIFDTIVGIFRGVITPLLCIFGFFGNSLIIIIFCSEKKGSRFSVYCITLAITHSLALFTNAFLDDFLGRGLSFVTRHSQFVFKLDAISNINCKLMEYLPNSLYFISSALVVIFSIDRLLTIYEPIKLFAAYYIKYAILSCILCILSGFILNIPLFMSYYLVKDKFQSVIGWKYKCDMLLSYPGTKVLSQFAIYNKLFGAFIIPTFIILVLNSLIIYKFWGLNKNFYGVKDTNANRIWKPKLRRQSTGIFFSKIANQDHELARIVGHIAVNSAFLLTTLPLVIVMILRIYSENHENVKRNVYYYNSLKHLSRLFSSVKDINYASNFFIYMKFLPHFYKGFIKFFNKICSCCNSKNKTDKRIISKRTESFNCFKKRRIASEVVHIPKKLSTAATQALVITSICQQTFVEGSDKQTLESR